MKPIAVDLGLSVRWADRNLGAEDIFLPGTLFIPSGRSKWKEEEVARINDYIKKNLGGRWRLPTVSEIRELQKACVIWPSIYKLPRDPMDETKGYTAYSIFKVKGKNGRNCYFNSGYHLLAGDCSDSSMSADTRRRPAIWDLKDNTIFYPYYSEQRSIPENFQNEGWYGRDYIPYGYYYGNGLPVRPVTDELPSGKDKFLRFLEYTGGDSNIEVEEKNKISFWDDWFRVCEEVSDGEKNKRYYERCEAIRRQEERKEREYEERQREKQCKEESSVSYKSESQNVDDYQEREMERELERERERERRFEEEQRKQERLEDWYREYVTIDVDLEYHYLDSEYNSDYWEYRNHEIRVSRREAMALIEAGVDAIVSRAGYACNPSLIRNVRYQIPYGLYDRPWDC